MAESFIPNSFQVPNAYVDKYLHLLAPDEWVVLTYIARRIFGFNKRQDHISLSQLSAGIVTARGERLDYGTGLSVPTVRKAMKALIKYGFVTKIKENDPAVNIGPLFELQLDERKVDAEGLQARADEKASAAKAKMNIARAARQSATPVMPLQACNDTTPPVMALQTPPVMALQTPPVMALQDNNQSNNQSNNQFKPGIPEKPKTLFDTTTPEGRGRLGAVRAIERGARRAIGLSEKMVSLFRIDPSFKTEEGKQFLAWFHDLPEGQTLEGFAQWWKQNDWRGKTGQPPTLKQIRELWPQAYFNPEHFTEEVSLAEQLLKQRPPAGTPEFAQWQKEYMQAVGVAS